MIFAFLSCICAALVALSLGLIGEFSIWDKMSVFGPTLVLFGIFRELWLLHKRLPADASAEAERNKHKNEVWAVLIVLIGVAIEVIVVPRSLVEVADLKFRTALLESTNAAMWQTNMQLRIALNDLEKRWQPRTITDEQRKKFLSVLSTLPKRKIMVFVGTPDVETLSYARQIRSLLDAAGCIDDRSHYTGEIAPGIYEIQGFSVEPQMPVGMSLGILVRDQDTNNTASLMLMIAFEQINIQTGVFKASESLLKTNELAIAITERH